MKFWGIAVLVLISIAFLEFPLTKSEEDNSLQIVICNTAPLGSLETYHQTSLYPNSSFVLNPLEIAWIAVRSEGAPVRDRYLLLDNNFDSVLAWKGHPKSLSSNKVYEKGFATLSTSFALSSLHILSRWTIFNQIQTLSMCN